MALNPVLSDAVAEIERVLRQTDDPCELMQQSDAVRAELAVVLTDANRKAAWRARTTGRFNDLARATWRGPKYLNMLANDHEKRQGLPHERVKDIITKRTLDLNDLARLRGTSR